MKIKILKEAADDTMPLNPEKRLSPQNAVRTARHMFRNDPVKSSSDPEIQKRYLKSAGLKSRLLAKMAQAEAELPDFVNRMSDAIQKDPTAADRIQDAMQTRELKQDAGQILLKIARGEDEAPGWTKEGGGWDGATAQVLQQYTYILAIEYSLIHSYRWGGASWAKIEPFIDAWLGKYLTNPGFNSPKAYAQRHKQDMEQAQKQGYIKDFDPENILYALRENKQTIKCTIRRKK